jgi:hypothetical protein
MSSPEQTRDDQAVSQPVASRFAVSLRGTYYPVVEYTRDYDEEKEETRVYVDFSGTPSEASARLVVDEYVFIHPSTSITVMGVNDNKPFTLYDQEVVASVIPGQDGFVGFKGEWSGPKDDETYKGAGFTWEATYFDPKLGEMDHIPPLPCGDTTVAMTKRIESGAGDRATIDLDELYGDDSDDSPDQEEAANK